MLTCRIGGHLVDQILQPAFQKRPVGMGHWDLLRPETRDAIGNTPGIDVTSATTRINDLGEGLFLSSAETRLILALAIVIHQHSKTDDTSSDQFYLGDGEPIALPHNLTAIRVSVSLYELATIFYGSTNIGGRSQNAVKDLLDRLCSNDRRFLIRMNIGQEVPSYEAFERLFNIEWPEQEPESGKKLTLTLHPIFVHDIAEKYLSLPIDLLQRLYECRSSKNVHVSVIRLMLELLRSLSMKRPPKMYRIGHEKLMQKLFINDIDRVTGALKHKKRSEEELQDAIGSMIEVGLIHDHSMVIGRSDQLHLFKLNRPFFNDSLIASLPGSEHDVVDSIKQLTGGFGEMTGGFGENTGAFGEKTGAFGGQYVYKY